MGGEEASRTALLLGAAGAASAAAILTLSRLAPYLGLIDLPGGRKSHARAVPVVGGLGVFLALLVVAWMAGVAPPIAFLLLALSLVIAVGSWDDVREIPPQLKLLLQILAPAIMIWGAGVQLHTVGDLLGVEPIGLWVLSVPLTIFAVVGVMNAVNMMDGVDGLAGSVALVAFAWYALVAASTGRSVSFSTAIIFCGAIAGFLAFNLRFPWQPHARIFLGDAGSLMIGFALSWLAIDLTQGPGRGFSPIAALWVVLLPLADCVSLMARRMARGNSPLVADRHHIHHYLQSRGLSHGQSLALLVTISTLCGGVGYFGWLWAIPEPVLFWAFFFGFFAYHFWMRREWRRIDARDALGRSEIPAGEKVATAG